MKDLPGTTRVVPLDGTSGIGLASSYDFVVVGGGSAGSVVASRLSEDPDVGVLLLEAGRADGPAVMSVPAAWPALLGSEVDWGYVTVPQSGLDGRAVHYARGK